MVKKIERIGTNAHRTRPSVRQAFHLLIWLCPLSPVVSQFRHCAVSKDGAKLFMAMQNKRGTNDYRYVDTATISDFH
jgi:hypothetical protein